jgi:HEAT repeat protein
MDGEEIVELNILDDVFELLTTTKERGFEDIISTQYSSDSKNKVIIYYCIKIIEKVGVKYPNLVYTYIPYLIKLLDSEFECIRFASAEALANIPSKLTIYAYPKLIKRLDNEVYAKVLVKLIMKSDNKEAILLKLFENFNEYALYVIKDLYKCEKKLVYEFIPLILKEFGDKGLIMMQEIPVD